MTDSLRSKPDFHADQIEQLAFELAFELEEADLSRDDLVTINRDKLKEIAARVISRASDAKDAEIARYRDGIKRLSDEEELCAETTGDDPFSMVYLAAKLANVEAENNRIRGQIEEAQRCLDDAPEYHYSGMGCGLEDRGITDRYDAMHHGWEQAMERVYGENIAWAKDALTSALNGGSDA